MSGLLDCCDDEEDGRVGDLVVRGILPQLEAVKFMGQVDVVCQR